MPRLSTITKGQRRKRIIAVLTVWLQMSTIISWFLTMLAAVSSIQTYRPRVRSYVLDFYANRDYVKPLVHGSDATCIEQVRMNKHVFFKLCEMLENI